MSRSRSGTSERLGPDYAAALWWFAASAAIGALLVGLVVAPLDPDEPTSLWVMAAAWPLANAPLVGLWRAWRVPARTPVARVGMARGNRILGREAGGIFGVVTILPAAMVGRQDVVIAISATTMTAACFQVFMTCQWRVRSRPEAVLPEGEPDLRRTPGVIEAAGLLVIAIAFAGTVDGEPVPALKIAALIIGWALVAAYFTVAIGFLERLFRSA